jgi:hypothetical protein
MGEQTVGQQRNAQAANDIDLPEEAADDASFLSPEETEGILGSLEKRDKRLLGGRDSANLEEEGNFISPEDIEGRIAEPETESLSGFDKAPPLRSERGQGRAQATETLQSDLLTRIAGELRSIKSDLGTLKTTYDDMMSKTSSITGEKPAAESLPPPELEPEPAGQFIPEKSLDEIKRLLGYLDRLLESLPEEKIDEFARSEYFELYRKIFEFFSLV